MKRLETHYTGSKNEEDLSFLSKNFNTRITKLHPLYHVYQTNPLDLYLYCMGTHDEVWNPKCNKLGNIYECYMFAVIVLLLLIVDIGFIGFTNSLPAFSFFLSAS